MSQHAYLIPSKSCIFSYLTQTKNIWKSFCVEEKNARLCFPILLVDIYGIFYKCYHAVETMYISSGERRRRKRGKGIVAHLFFSLFLLQLNMIWVFEIGILLQSVFEMECYCYSIAVVRHFSACKPIPHENRVIFLVRLRWHSRTNASTSLCYMDILDIW